MGFRFKLKLLRSVDLALKNVIREGGLPERLRCKKLNGEYDLSKCEDCARNEREAERGAIWEQCTKCAVAVSQTKVGITLQFEWHSDAGGPVHCSAGEPISSF